jgi:hypothetical protein
MKAPVLKTSVELTLAQIAWVVKDIKAAERLFRESMGVTNFSNPEIIRLGDYEATYYGEPNNAESLVSMVYTGGIFIELIQPHSGHSIFRDYLNKCPDGGVHHIAYRTPVVNLDKVISEMADKGFPVVTHVNTPIADIVFFDTTKDIGVFTEIMGITEAGVPVIEKMKSGTF